MFFADGGQGLDVRDVAEIIRACDVHGGRVFRYDHVFELRGGDGAGNDAFRAVDPANVKVEQRCGRHEDLVCVTACRNDGLFVICAGMQQRKIQHGADAQGRALGGIDRLFGAE